MASNRRSFHQFQQQLQLQQQQQAMLQQQMMYQQSMAMAQYAQLQQHQQQQEMESYQEPQRMTCPNCNSYGFVHNSSEPHTKKGRHERCEYCVGCSTCSGAGVLEGKLPCKKCRARGFYHSSRASGVHDQPSHIRCWHCKTCQDCRGRGALTIQTMPMARPTSPILAQESVPEKRSSCPRCHGEGFFHDLYAEHIPRKPGQKITCPGCSSCIACDGHGVVVNKTGCKECGAKGFSHQNKSQEHDNDPEKRCFWCRNCAACRATGVVDLYPEPRSPTTLMMPMQYPVPQQMPFHQSMAMPMHYQQPIQPQIYATPAGTPLRSPKEPPTERLPTPEAKEKESPRPSGWRPSPGRRKSEKTEK